MRKSFLAILITVISITVYAQPGTQITWLSPYIPYYTNCHTETEMTIGHSWRYYAMYLFATQDNTDDPVFEFCDECPCPWYRPTEDYQDGAGRMDCNRTDGHTGLDVLAPEGTPIVAAAKGYVTYAGPFSRGKINEVADSVTILEPVWNGIDKNGIPVSSGLYLVRLKTASTSINQKVLLLK